jgi:hypothetical protein
MRQLLAGIRSCVVVLGVMLLTLIVVPSSFNVARSDQSETSAACNSDELVIYQGEPPDGAAPCAGSRTSEEIAEARAYLVETASPGYSMTLQGAEVAIERLHPEFAVRLEHAIRDARNGGLPSAAVFSAYRPPAFGVGGFHDKFNSLHTYGLAVDMRGIGKPGSAEAQLWHEIAARNGVVCPYGPRDHAEWNHCQATSIKIIRAGNPLRETVTSTGPVDLDTMFEAGDSIIEDMASAAQSLSRAALRPVRILEAAAKTPAATPAVALSRKRRNSPIAALRGATAKPARHAKFGPRVGGSASRARHT